MSEYKQPFGDNPYAQAVPGEQSVPPEQGEVPDFGQVPPGYGAGAESPEMPPWGHHPHGMHHHFGPYHPHGMHHHFGSHDPYGMHHHFGFHHPHGMHPHYSPYFGPAHSHVHPAYQGYPYPPDAFAADGRGQTPPPPDKESGINAMLKGIGESMGLGNLAELLSIDDKEFWKGAALGATIALLATNDGVKENLMATVARLMATMKATANGGDSNPEKEEFDHSGGTGSEPSA